MKINYDNESDAAYIYLKEISEGEVDKTISLNDSINIDLDSDGKVIGIEILNANKNLPINTINSVKVKN